MHDDPYRHIPMDKKASKCAAAWEKEWALQLALLPQEKQNAIFKDPMHPGNDHLDELVEKILCERGEM